jgi:hypothetical protein
MAYGTLLLRLDEHREALAALWRENMSDARIGDVVPERMRWLYERNPAGAAITWLGVVAGEGTVIGCGSVFPRRMWVQGRSIQAGVLADFAVTKTHRVAGAAIAIQRAVAKGSLPAGVQFLYGYPNEKAVAIFKRLGYKHVGDSTVWIKPLRSEYKLRERITHAGLVSATAAVVDTGLAVADKALSLVAAGARLRRGDRRKFDVVALDRADERFDDLWIRARGEYSIVGEKSSAYLNWRYTEFTTKKHVFFCLADKKSGALAGYAVYSVIGHKAVIADLFCENLAVTSKALLLRLASHLRRAGVSSIVFNYLGSEAFASTLKAAGFLRRSDNRSMIAYVDPKGPEELRNVVFDRYAWFMIDGELDI